MPRMGRPGTAARTGVFIVQGGDLEESARYTPYYFHQSALQRVSGEVAGFDSL